MPATTYPHRDSRTGALRRRCHLVVDAAVVDELAELAAIRGVTPTALGALLLTDAVRAARTAAHEEASRAAVIATLAEAVQ